MNVIRFELPALREKKQDIPLLLHHFLKKFSRLYQKEISVVAPAATQALMSYDYPGNVRELENIIERGVIYCRGDRLEVKDLLLEDGEEALLSETPEDLSSLSFREAKDRVLQMFHSQYVVSLLRGSDGNVSRAAETAGIQRQYLHRLMKEAGIDAENFKDKGDPEP